MKRRRGATLIEITVVIALAGAALTTVSLTLHTLYRSEHRVRQALEWEHELDRLAGQLRQDAHPAVSATAEAGPEPAETGTLSLVGPEGDTIQYARQADWIERTVRRGQTIRHRETYRLPAATTARWQISRQHARPVISLVIDGPHDGTPRARDSYRVDAVVRLWTSRQEVAQP
jgi:type II secretory pathway component PulJ